MQEEARIEVEFNLKVLNKTAKIRISDRNIESLLKKLDELDLGHIRKELENKKNIFSHVEESSNFEVELTSNAASFVKQFNSTKDMDRILVSANYLVLVRNEKIFNKFDLENIMQEAMISLPGNLNDMLNKLEQKNYIAESKEKKDGLKSFYLTHDGVDYVKTLKL